MALTLFAGCIVIILAYIRTPSPEYGFRWGGSSTSGSGGWQSGSKYFFSESGPKYTLRSFELTIGFGDGAIVLAPAPISDGWDYLTGL